MKSEIETRVAEWFSAVNIDGYEKYSSFAQEFKKFPLVCCESADQQDYEKLSDIRTVLKSYKVFFCIADEIKAGKNEATIKDDLWTAWESVFTNDTNAIKAAVESCDYQRVVRDGKTLAALTAILTIRK